MERRGFLARILALIGGAVAVGAGMPAFGSAAGGLLGAELPLDSHAEEELAAFDRELGVAPCEGGCGALVKPRIITDWPSLGGACFAIPDGGYEAMPSTPVLRQAHLCDACCERQSLELQRDLEVVDRAALRYSATQDYLGTSDIVVRHNFVRIVNLTEQ